jgi:hypothetical protein
MPVIDKPSFLRRYKNVMDNKDDHVVARSEAAFLSLVFAVFSCAAQLVQDPRLTIGDRQDDGGIGMFYYERYARCIFRPVSHLTSFSLSALVLQYISHANIQIAHVQCFILLSSFLCSVNCLPQAWILIGQAVRLGQDLGLHVGLLYSSLSYDNEPLHSAHPVGFSSALLIKRPEKKYGGDCTRWIVCSHLRWAALWGSMIQTATWSCPPR